MSLLETFLGSVESITSAHEEPRTRISGLPDGFAYLTPYLLRRTYRWCADLSSCVIPSLHRLSRLMARRGSFPPALRCRSVSVTRPILRSASIRRKIPREGRATTLARRPLLPARRVMSSEESKLTSVVAEYERLGHRLRFSASA